MADDDNTAAELPPPVEENSGGDIEQGRSSSSSSWVAAAISGRTSTPTPSTTTTRPQGGLEHVDVEEAAPVPLIQQIAEMDMAEIEEGNTNANIHANVAPSEDVSMTMTPQPPKQGAGEATVAADRFQARLHDKLLTVSDGHTKTKEGEPALAAAASVNAEVARANHDKERKSKLMGRKAFAAVDILEARLNDKLLTGSDGRKKEGGAPSAAAASVNAEVARANHDKERKSKLMGRKAFAAVDILEARLNDKLLTGSLNANTNTHANVASSEDASMTPQPPQQSAMEQIKDGDDGAAPRPLNYAEFEDESKAKLDLGEESADEDDGPPLPFQQRDSLSDAKEMAATSQISSSAAASPIAVDGNESVVGGDSTVGDEENALRRVVRPETPAANYNEQARRVGSTAAAERYPSVPILEAYLVEEEGPPPPTAVVTPTPPPIVPVGGHDTVYEATPLEPELPWWKQRRTKVFMVINFVLVLIAALAVGLSVSPRSSPPPDPAAGNTTSITATTPTTAPIATTGASSSSVSLPTKPSYRCFADRKELKTVVDLYVKNGCGAVSTLCRDLSDTYGWPMGSWCVIDVTDMSSLFKGLDAFDENISMWNVSQVTDMSYMFAETGTFNRDLSSWNVSSVTNMSYMFQNATSFNQNLCAWQDNFPFSSATDIFVGSGCAYKGTPSSETKGPFCASSCNIATAATECFTTRDELKDAVDRYVQGYWGTTDSSKYGWPIGSWCVRKVTDMSNLFEGLDTFNEDISEWEVGQVTEMEGMFFRASSFNQDLFQWNTSSVTQMSGMFNEASAFDGNISSWDTSAVTDMSWMFRDASSFNQQDLSKWDTSAVTTMKQMFYLASAFDGNISSWDTSAVTDMSFMFWGASSFNQEDLSKWDTSAVTTMANMFTYASAFDGNISSWDTSAVTDMSQMFYGASSFNQEDLSKWDTSAVTTMKSMFYEASAFDGNISSWDTSAVTDMSFMFCGASSFNQEDLSKWDTSAVTTMKAMFKGASAFNGNVSSWDTSAVTDMSYMFYGASSFSQEDLSIWDTSSVTTMYDMFYEASAFNGSISSWNTSAVTDMSYMFWAASSFNQKDLSNWETSAVTTMREMFTYASAFDGNISSWDTSAVTDMSYMFYKATSFNQNLCAWKDNFPYNNATDIFLDSDCTIKGTPQIEQQGPFCASDCTNS